MLHKDSLTIDLNKAIQDDGHSDESREKAIGENLFFGFSSKTPEIPHNNSITPEMERISEINRRPRILYK